MALADATSQVRLGLSLKALSSFLPEFNPGRDASHSLALQSERLDQLEGSALARLSQADPLVTSCISQRAWAHSIGNVTHVDIYRRDIVVKRSPIARGSRLKSAARGQINAFSDASRRRLRFSAANSSSELISQMALTYHNSNPSGSDVKKHLNAFLTWLRRRVPALAYLWVLEFQTRGVPHVHLFLNIPAEPGGELQNDMARAWNRITDESKSHLAFHQHAKNFIAWDMGSASYLTKYLDKEAQKSVPEGFGWVGRFWGASRGLVGSPVQLTADEIREYFYGSSADPLVIALRAVSKFQAAQWRNARAKKMKRLGVVIPKSGRKTLMQKHSSVTVNNGADVFWRVLEYLQNE